MRVPPPQPTRGLGERRKLPNGVRGGAPAEKGFGCILSLKKTNLVTTNLIFLSLLWHIFRVIFTRL